MWHLQLAVLTVFCFFDSGAARTAPLSNRVAVLMADIPVSVDQFVLYVENTDELHALLQSEGYVVEEISNWISNEDGGQQRCAKFTSHTKAFFGSYTTHVTKTQQLATNNAGAVTFTDTVDARFTGSRLLSDMHTVCLWRVTQGIEDPADCLKLTACDGAHRDFHSPTF